MERGFSTLELMIAFAVLAIVFSGAALASYGAQYWTIALKNSYDALFEGKKQIEDVQRVAEHDYWSATSSSMSTSQTDCNSSVCYYTKRTVTDLSSCAKYAQIDVSYQVPGYPTTTIPFSASLTNVPAVLALGGDCSTNPFVGDWTSLHIAQANFGLHGIPAGVDELDGTVYIVENQPSALEIITEDQSYSYTPPDGATFNAVDVARDLFTGRTYAYIVATSSQLRVVDVTDPSAPVLVASKLLATVPAGLEAGWRLHYYDQKLYVVTRFLSKPSAQEFHIFDVSDPTVPQEVSNFKLSTSAYAIVVRDQYSDFAKHRFAYLATTHTAKELVVLDVTDPFSIATAATCDLPSTQQGTTLHLSGNILYVGRENVPSGGEDLYAFDATDPKSSSFCTPLGKTDINDDSFSRHVQAIFAAGDYLFVATNNTTNAHGKIQVRSSDPATNMKILGVFAIPSLSENSIDYNGDTNVLSAAGAGAAPGLYQITSNE